ncbi:MAG: hypothetical protein JWM94_1953, partial [Sphingomonas bacterium]|nr:hypothetical protein [Sphingomonas bacterium]
MTGSGRVAAIGQHSARAGALIIETRAMCLRLTPRFGRRSRFDLANAQMA